MSLYASYLDEIETRNIQGLAPKPIDDGALVGELIAQIKDQKHKHRAESLRHLIYNTLPGTTSAAGVSELGARARRTDANAPNPGKKMSPSRRNVAGAPDSRDSSASLILTNNAPHRKNTRPNADGRCCQWLLQRW